MPSVIAVGAPAAWTGFAAEAELEGRARAPFELPGSRAHAQAMKSAAPQITSPRDALRGNDIALTQGRPMRTVSRPTRTKFTTGLATFAMTLLALTGAADAQARGFTVVSGCRMQFVSDAPLERTTGVSTSMTGEIQLDPTNLAGSHGRIQVPIASIRTGSDLRDEHLHGPTWLDAEHNPNAIFEITAVEGATTLAAGQVTQVTLIGTFTVHGVSHAMRASAQVRWMPHSPELESEGIHGDLIRAQASFTVNLPDHNVSVNPLVRLKVSDQIRVNVTLRATSG
jgi:polyisoprenoid-binding protein YceI